MVSLTEAKERLYYTGTVKPDASYSTKGDREVCDSQLAPFSVDPRAVDFASCSHGSVYPLPEPEACIEVASTSNTGSVNFSDRANAYFHRKNSNKEQGSAAGSTAPKVKAKTRQQPKRNVQSAYATLSAVVDSDEDRNLARQEKNLERNRIAASKCRQRKKTWVQKLEEKKASLEAEHTELRNQVLELLQDLMQVKNYLICHSGCHDKNINAWVDREASEFVRRLSEAHAQPQTGSSPFFSGSNDSVSSY